MTARYPLVRVGGRTTQLPSGDTLLGAGAVNFTDTSSVAAPNATIAVSAFTAAGPTTVVDAALVPKSTGAVLAAVPDNGITGGNKRGANAVDLQTARVANTQVAGGDYSVVCGGRRNAAGSTNAVAVGGLLNNAAGTYSFVGSGSGSTSSGNNSAIVGGTGNSSPGDYSFIGGGQFNSADGINSIIAGGAYGSTRGVNGMWAWGGVGTVLGRHQETRLLIKADTTTAAVTRLTSVIGAAASAINVHVLPNTSSFKCRIEVVARNTATGDSASWECKALIKREANAASTSMVGTPTVTQEFASTAMAACGVAITADTTLGALAVTVTGIAATSIRWASIVKALEVTN